MTMLLDGVSGVYLSNALAKIKYNFRSIQGNCAPCGAETRRNVLAMLAVARPSWSSGPSAACPELTAKVSRASTERAIGQAILPKIGPLVVCTST
jgi:hypothetical protein